MLTLPRPFLDKMIRHLEAGYPHEACGILVGEINDPATKVVREVILVDNVWTPGGSLGQTQGGEPESRSNRYAIAPEDIARADREAGKRGWDVIGFFHSHPDHPSHPSETDREWAWPVISFVITSVCDGKATTTQSWVLRDDRTTFEEEPLVIEHDS